MARAAPVRQRAGRSATESSGASRVTSNPVEWDGETFDRHSDAKAWKGLIDVYTQQRPPAEVLLAHGFGFLIRGAVVVAAAPEPAENLDAPATPEEPTFLECAEKLIDDLDHVLGYTKRLYRGMLKNHVAPHLGSKGISEVGHDQVKAWQREMTRRGLSRKTIANIRGSVIIPVLNAACKPQDNGRKPPLILGNPIGDLKLPAGRKKRRDVITSQEDITLYLQCAYEVDPDAGDLLTVAITTGMRWGDLAGLRCRDIDLNEAEIPAVRSEWSPGAHRAASAWSAGTAVNGASVHVPGRRPNV